MGHVFGEQQMPRKTCGQDAAYLDDAVLTSSDGLESEWISYDHVAKCGSVFVSFRTIRIDNPYGLHHAVEVDDSLRAAPDDSGQLLVENSLLDSLVLQALPAAAVQNLGLGQVQRDARGGERLDQVVPENIGEAIHQNLFVLMIFCEGSEFIEIQRQISLLANVEAVGRLTSERLQTLDRRAPSPQLAAT